jgi:hypothetical protein
MLTIEPTLQAAEVRSAVRPTNDLTAYDLYLRALATLSNNKRGTFQSSRTAPTGDSGRSALWSGAVLGGDVPNAAR